MPERLLHPARRRAAFAALARLRSVQSILVVCNGNIFRSPFAAAVLERALAREGWDELHVESAGLIGPGRSSPADAVEAAARRGVDLRAHRSQLVTPGLVRAADVILVMEPAQQRIICERFGRTPRAVLVLGDFDPAPVETRAIADPWEQSPDVCGAVYDRISACIGAFVQGLRTVAMD